MIDPKTVAPRYPNWKAMHTYYDKLVESDANIVLGEGFERWLASHDEHIWLEARRKAVIQCAIEAGERSPGGISSHTMLGDMWDARIAELEVALKELT